MMQALTEKIKQIGIDLGFQQVGITDTNLSTYEQRFEAWLANNFHGEMAFMQRHGTKRYRPAELESGTIRVISARLNYLPPHTSCLTVLGNSKLGYISRYALGKDYHRLMRKRLQSLAEQVSAIAGPFGYRAFCDSAPVLEKPLAEKAGLGWIGKHTNLINHQAGSWFFLGEIYTDLPLIIDAPIEKNRCGSCTACIDVCPTQAIVGPYQLDARKCISYLTIELRGSIPVEYRKLMGNRIYGCDDCQLVCPWNKFAKFSAEDAFTPRHHLDAPGLLELFNWTEQDFLKYTEGSAIRRIGYDCWLRNIAVAIGNANYHPDNIIALETKKNSATTSDLVKEHIEWALNEQKKYTV